MTKYTIIFMFAIGLVITSCKQDTTSKSSPQNSTGYPESYLKALNSFKNEATKENGQLLFTEIRKALITNPDQPKMQEILEIGLDAAEKLKMGNMAIAYLMPLVKEYPNHPKKEDYLAKLASALQDIGKEIPGNILTEAYIQQYPKGRYTGQLAKKQTEDIKDMDAHMAALAEKVFENPDKFGINKLNAQKYVDACEAYALAYPNSDYAPEYLYKAGEMARTLKTYPKAIDIYDWLEKGYPSYPKTPTVMLMKGFILDNDLGNKEAAREVYQNFLQKFPKDDLVDDVQFLLENIDKTDEEIMKMIEPKK